MSATEIRLVFNKLPLVEVALEKGVPLAIEKGARDIEAHAKSTAPVDTGTLRNSITAEQLSALAWIVFVGAYYGIYVEMGTYKMGARPFLLPAFETVQASIVAAVETLLRSL